MSIIKPGTAGLCPSCPALPQTRQWGFPAPQGPLRPAGTKAAPTQGLRAPTGRLRYREFLGGRRKQRQAWVGVSHQADAESTRGREERRWGEDNVGGQTCPIPTQGGGVPPG